MSSPARTRAPRQATACQWCRAHKLKCDAEQPSCRNCARRKVACVTTNLRKPDAEGRRQLPLGRRRRSQAPGASTTTTPTSARVQTVSPSTSHTEYPLPLPSPPHRNFETGSPERLLPGLFATPFHEEEPEEEGDGGQSVVTPASHSTRTSHNTPMTVSSGSRQTQTNTSTASSHYLLVQWLDLFFMQNPAWQPVFPHFRQGLAYTSEIPLPSPFLSIGAPSPGLPKIPPTYTMDKYIGIFFKAIHPLFPILDGEAFTGGVSQLRQNHSASDYGLLASIYAVCSIAVDEETGGVSDDGTRYLEAAYVLYAHLVARPSLSSVQALLLLTLALRNRNKDAASWGTLGQAIRLAQAINLHRDDGSDDEQGELSARVWWTAYILERTMELETGRPSAIRDDECDQREPRSLSEPGQFDYFGSLIRLAKLKTRASHLLYSGGRRFPGQRTVRPVKDLLFEMGHIDRALLDWADTFPESTRPGRDIFCGSDELPLATYVGLQFHQTLLALHRPALLSAPGFLRNRINTYCAGTPLRDRLHFSLCIGAASARSMLKATNDLLMYSPVPGRVTRLVTADQILLAVLVLGIYAAKVPMSRLNRSDLALVDTFGELVEEEYRKAGHNPEFVTGIFLFRTQLCDYIAGLQGRTVPTAATSCHAPVPEAEMSTATRTETPSMDEFGFDLSMDATDLESSWAHFWNEDFEKLLAVPQTVEGEQETVNMANVTNMYLLGIPQSWP